MSLFSAAVAAALMLAPGIEPPPVIPPATIDDSLEITGESLEAQQLRSRLFIDVEINATGPYRFLVDSGADRSVVSAELAARLGLPAEGIVRMRTMVGVSEQATVLIERLGIGRSVVETIVAPALPERFIGADGIIGIDALSDQRLLLDFEKKAVTIQDSRTPVKLEEGEIVVTARRRKGQLIITQASIEGDRTYAVIDTGAELTIGNLAMLKRLQRGKRLPAMQPVVMVSVAGERMVAQATTLPELRVGGIIIRNVVVAFSDAPPFALFGLERQPALLLGTDLLKNFRRLSLDFRNRKVRFTLRRNGGLGL